MYNNLRLIIEGLFLLIVESQKLFLSLSPFFESIQDNLHYSLSET